MKAIGIFLLGSLLVGSGVGGSAWIGSAAAANATNVRVPLSVAQTGNPHPDVRKMIAIERSAHVGELLPEGVKFIDREGSTVDLRRVLRGPAIVFKVRPDCPSCEDLLDMLRATNGTLPRGVASIAVVQVASHDEPDLPPAILALHTRASLEVEGFLGGHITPTVFYFDKDLRLVGRSLGAPADARASLQFP